VVSYRASHVVFSMAPSKRTKQNKNKQKPKRVVRRAVRSTKRVVRPNHSGFSMTECARKYFVAIARPFDPDSRGACIPIFPSRPSQKITARKRGTFSAGTTGFGYIAVAPTIMRDFASIFTTTQFFEQSTINATTASVLGQLLGAFETLPYNRVDCLPVSDTMPASVAGRIISYGIRVRYIGTELNLGGSMCLYVDPGHGNLNSFDYASLSSRSEAINLSVSRQWSETVIFSFDTIETEYPQSLVAVPNSSIRVLFPLSSGEALTVSSLDDLTGAVPLVVAVSGATVGATFEYELIAHVEYIGSPTQSAQTVSHVDLDGMSKVQNSANSSYIHRASSGDRTQSPSMFASLIRTLREHESELRYAATALGGMLAPSAIRRVRRIGN